MRTDEVRVVHGSDRVGNVRHAPRNPLPPSQSPDHAPIHLRCQLCGREPLERFEIPGSSTLWFCRTCELYQYGRSADAAAYDVDYHAGYARHRAQKVRTAAVRLNRIAGLQQVPEPWLLEIGCSIGSTLEAAAARGWKAMGVDVSQDAVDMCRKQGHMSLRVGPVELPFTDRMFDMVVAWHVVEHVADVRQTLAEWYRVLKAGGFIALETPDATCPKVRRLGTGYRKFWAPEHTYTFTARNLGRFLNETGFEIVRPPWLGPLRRIPLRMAAYATAYQTYHRLRQMAGIEKAFFIVGRKSAHPATAAVA